MSTRTSVPLVSVVLPARDAGAFLRPAMRSILGQTLDDLELIVVDDGSTDETRNVLGAVDDARLVVIRNEEPAGLPTALNQALDRARGTYVARMDADDVSLPSRLERQVARLRVTPGLVAVGSAVAELSGEDDVVRVHRLPAGAALMRWRALFGTPAFHPSLVVERAVLERHGIRYDPDLGVAQDFALWRRLLEVGEVDNLEEVLLLYRVHERQLSAARAETQEANRRAIALEAIGAAAPALGDAASLAWAVGDMRPVPAGEEVAAADAYLALLDAVHAPPEVHRYAARALARLAARTRAPRAIAAIGRRVFDLDPAFPLTVAGGRARDRQALATVRSIAPPWLRSLERPDRPVRVSIVLPEPTPYRAPLLDLLAARSELELQVVYAADTVAGRTWNVEIDHPATFLRGKSVPGARRVLRHDYPVTFGVGSVLDAQRPDVVVASGWSTFAAQAAIVWSWRARVPYLLVVESHDRDARAVWRRAIKQAVVPRVVGGASGILATGSLVAESMIARGASPDRIHRFANTVDVEAFAARADALRPRRSELRADLGIGSDRVAVLCVSRLVPEKAIDTLLRAVREAGHGLVPVLAGEGPARGELERLSTELGVGTIFLGDVPWERIVEAYVAADLFALVSRHEPWGVVVNEAAACGLPLVLSEHVGAAPDLLEDGRNGSLVPVDDVAATSAALRRWATSPEAHAAAGARSRAIAAAWGYGPSVEGFVQAVNDALRR